MQKRGKVIFLFLFMLSVIMNSMSTAFALVDDETELITRFEEKIIPLNTVEAGNGFQDMMELKELFKDKEIIGMGEATHGTREFFQMKHRMFEFLVQEMGYRVFVIEAEFGGSQKVNDYILYNKGTLGDALDAMKFWTWSTEEVAEMISWMKEFNDNESDENKKIRFYGMDMQSLDVSVEYIIEYIDKVDEDSKRFKSALKKISDNIEKKTVEDLKEEIDIVNELLKRFEVKREEYINKTSEEEYEINLQHLNVVIQSIGYNTKVSVASFNYRDKYQAENVQWIHNFEKKRGNDKLMIWAHNGHVEKYNYNYITLGNNLYNHYGDKYYSVAFDFFKGGFRAKDDSIAAAGEKSFELKDFTMESKGERILSLEFEKLNSNLFMLDFQQAIEDEEIKQWFSEPKYIISIGAVFNKTMKYFYKEEITPLVNYDAIIFIEETTAAKGYNVSSYEKVNEQKVEQKLEQKVEQKFPIVFVIGILVVGVMLFIVVKKTKKKL